MDVASKSALGSLLFLELINDLPTLLSAINQRRLVDDTTIIENPLTIKEYIQNDKVDQWMRYYQLKQQNLWY